MGNTQSVPEEAEDDNTCTVKSYQPLHESPDGIKNGSVVFVQSLPLAVNGGADAEAGAARDNAAVPAAGTMERGPAGGQSPGPAARRAAPAARPRSAFALPWAVPGRTEGPAADPAPPAAAPDVSAVNKAPREGSGGPGAAAPQGRTDKTPSRAPPAEPLRDVALAGTPEGHDAASKPRAVTILDRIFGLEKGKDGSEARGDPQEGRRALDVADGSIAASAPDAVPRAKEIDDCNQRDLGQDSAGVQGLAAAAPGEAQVEQDSAQAAAAHSSVMSFLKTLVSPSKAEAKSDSEDKGSKAEKGHGGQPAPKPAPESPSKGAKKKKAESPKLGHSTFSKLFRHKAAKETQQTTNTKSPEQPPVPSAKPDRSVPAPQEPPAKQNPKAPEPAAPAQGASAEPPREASRDKGSATPLPLSKLFWKKNSSEEAEAASSEKAEVAPEAAAPARDESRSPEAAEAKPRGTESKTPKANLRKFFKLSGKGDGTPSSAEGNGPSPRHHTLNATERPESDPGGPKGKEGSKDKKATLELGKKGKQEGREQQPEPREPPAADPDSIHNGGDASREASYKKMEKRQSLGGFFKGLGSKRMSDAEVQTDPVSILPAGKSK